MVFIGFTFLIKAEINTFDVITFCKDIQFYALIGNKTPIATKIFN